MDVKKEITSNGFITPDDNMDIKKDITSNGFITPDVETSPDITLERIRMGLAELLQLGHFIVRILNWVLVLVTNLLARVLGSDLVRSHFHLALSGMVLFGPLLSLWVSKYSIFANKHHYLYRTFLVSTWGWTSIFTGSFVFLLYFSVYPSICHALSYLPRLGVTGLLLWLCRRLLATLENATGTCYEPMAQDGGSAQGSGTAGQSLLLLHEGQTKASCLRAGMTWRGYEVSQDVLVLCVSCLLLVEYLSLFKAYLSLDQESRKKSIGSPLRLVFLLCVFLLAMCTFLLLCQLAHFPQFPSQLLGGAVGCLGWRGLQRWYGTGPDPNVSAWFAWRQDQRKP